jgi:molybdate transport system regulatory protein
MGMKVGYKLWFEVEGKMVMGPGRAELLHAIDELGSLSAAARKMDLSYRHAYQLVQDLNDRCGECVLISSIGGKTGGGMSLTPYGRELLAEFERAEDVFMKKAKTFDDELNEHRSC